MEIRILSKKNEKEKNAIKIQKKKEKYKGHKMITLLCGVTPTGKNRIQKIWLLKGLIADI